MAQQLSEFTSRLEDLARDQGLDYYPVDFELVPPSFMMEVAVYGLPVRMPHWSFGVRYIYQLVQARMGNSRIFEVIFPGNPNHAYLATNNSLSENTLVAAHVLGHADFSHNNLLFKRSHRELGAHIVEQAAARAHRIEEAIATHGVGKVEAVLDAALALEQHIDVNQQIDRSEYVADRPGNRPPPPSRGFQQRFNVLPGEEDTPNPADPRQRDRRTAPTPPRPERDLLWFIAHYAPDMDEWERDIFLAVREESYYFYPVFSCQIMNEGWAVYWHARLLREADFLPEQVYLDAIKSHSDVVSPFASGEREVALAINPYHLGFAMWERIVAERGLEEARRIRDQEDDFGFVRNYLDRDLAEELQLFIYRSTPSGRLEVGKRDIYRLQEELLKPKFNFGAPSVVATEIGQDGSLVLSHQFEVDGKGLDLEKGQKVIEYIHRVWRRPVSLYTVDSRGTPQVLKVSGRDD